MGTPELKELQIKIEELLKKGYTPKCVTFGRPDYFFEEERWNLKDVY
jgi:hypothetical protein